MSRLGRALTDPRLAGVAGALPRTAVVLNRARAPRSAGVPGVRLTPGLAASVMLDEVLISVMRDPRLFPSGDDYEKAAAEIRAALRLFSSEGWLADPASYHADPPVPVVRVGRERAFDQRYEHLSFDSGYAPPAGVPGAERWLASEPNRTAHAWLLRHSDPAAPWLVCLHGFGMGQAALDLRGFRAASLHRNHGLNVAVPVLPRHGSRQEPGRHRGEGFMSINLVDSVHGLAQAAWDVRSVIAWIRSIAGPAVPIGVYGISLGGYVSALVASLEDGLAAAIAGIPCTDLPDLYRRHSPVGVRRRAFQSGALGPEADAVHSVVSPLRLAPRLARDRRFIFAGVGDRMSTAGQARRLWEHWDRPAIDWYPGGHIGFFLAGGVARFVTSALVQTGLAPSPSAAASPPSPGPPSPARPAPGPGGPPCPTGPG